MCQSYKLGTWSDKNLQTDTTCSFSLLFTCTALQALCAGGLRFTSVSLLLLVVVLLPTPLWHWRWHVEITETGIEFVKLKRDYRHPYPKSARPHTQSQKNRTFFFFATGGLTHILHTLIFPIRIIFHTSHNQAKQAHMQFVRPNA